MAESGKGADRFYGGYGEFEDFGLWFFFVNNQVKI